MPRLLIFFFLVLAAAGHAAERGGRGGDDFLRAADRSPAEQSRYTLLALNAAANLDRLELGADELQTLTEFAAHMREILANVNGADPRAREQALADRVEAMRRAPGLLSTEAWAIVQTNLNQPRDAARTNAKATARALLPAAPEPGAIAEYGAKPPREARLDAGLPRQLVRIPPIEQDYPVGRLLDATRASGGRFLIGWENSDPQWTFDSINFKETVRVEALEGSHPLFAVADGLWRQSQDRFAIGKYFQSVSNGAPETLDFSRYFPTETGMPDYLRARKRGVAVAMFRLLDDAGAELGRETFTRNHPSGYSIRESRIREFVEGLGDARSRVAQVELWRTTPNGAPFTAQDEVGMTTSIQRLFDELLPPGRDFRYVMHAVGEADGRRVLYTMEPRWSEPRRAAAAAPLQAAASSGVELGLSGIETSAVSRLGPRSRARSLCLRMVGNVYTRFLLAWALTASVLAAALIISHLHS